ncbi:hypothetical protein CTP10_R65440 (plasmid) [Cupriavidus sp. P-10]|uniref:hypothetical protein n=1 Tax=Cupriavidus sp. P-10 TaxID=2027911 RepID=UPI0011C19F41|nr:hypothetical protein [Cupriavidus sp. P-10]BDB29131.1 hypothetical protein CTP10_R65440 [Cupriavidus sp. P-10]
MTMLVACALAPEHAAADERGAVRFEEWRHFGAVYKIAPNVAQYEDFTYVMHEIRSAASALLPGCQVTPDAEI